MIHLLKSKATTEQITEMEATLGSYIKLAVDVERKIAAGGGALHADCEAALLEDGSLQDNVWGADWLPYSKEVTFESLINSVRAKTISRWRLATKYCDRGSAKS